MLHSPPPQGRSLSVPGLPEQLNGLIYPPGETRRSTSSEACGGRAPSPSHNPWRVPIQVRKMNQLSPAFFLIESLNPEIFPPPNHDRI
jgi:hypothetical protein